MRLKNLKYFFPGLLISSFSSVAEAQAGLCPPNLDFEKGLLIIGFARRVLLMEMAASHLIQLLRFRVSIRLLLLLQLG
jgi:hypothetical protein